MYEQELWNDISGSKGNTMKIDEVALAKEVTFTRLIG